MTDSEGRFAFRSLPRGSLSLTAQKNGYLDGAYGRHRPGGATQQLALEEGERVTDVTIRLFKPAAISGMVADERGEPVVGTQVRAYRRSLLSGRSAVISAGVGTTTDDRGMYRLVGLIPGEYLIEVPNVSASTPDVARAATAAPATSFNMPRMAIILLG